MLCCSRLYGLLKLDSPDELQRKNLITKVCTNIIVTTTIPSSRWLRNSSLRCARITNMIEKLYYCRMVGIGGKGKLFLCV